MARFCSVFYCDERGDRFCCADCWLKRDCGHPCQNHPTRCRLALSNGKPAERHGGNGKLKPLRRKRREVSP